MKKFFETICGVICGYISGTFEEIAEAIEAKDAPRAIKKAITILVIGLCVLGFLALILAFLYASRKAIFAVVAPVIMIVVLVKSYQLNHPGTDESPPTQSPGTIELAKARAEKIYPLLSQTAFILLSELCRYLPGLVKPFSLKEIVPPVHYEISASFVTIHHFIIGKGDCETDRQTMWEILETLLDQHLQAHDLPLSISANYISADGEIFPGILVDGIYDAGQHYRVDLVLCSEAAVTRLKTREVTKTDGYATTAAVIKDEDFD